MGWLHLQQMTSILHKKTTFFLSLILTIGILAPSVIKLGHSIYEHNSEKQCVAQGTVHIHDGDLDCDFHDFNLASKVLFSPVFENVSIEVPYVALQTDFYVTSFKPHKFSYHALRGPPVVS